MPAEDARFRGGEIRDLAGVGLVGACDARIWLRTEHPGRLRIEWHPARGAPPGGRWEGSTEVVVPPDNERDNTHSVCIGREGAGGSLAPDCPYRYRVHRTDPPALIGEGRFHTAPDPDRRGEGFSFLVASCNQPFDSLGLPDPRAQAMLRAVHRLVAERDVRFLLATGDQMYADYPPNLSLFDPEHFATIAPPGRTSLLGCTTKEVRAIFQQRYRRWWNVPEWTRLLAELPTLPMLDDHEIVDNWGSHPDHDTRAWQAVGEGARAAYADYQGSRVAEPGPLPPHFDYAFDYGPVGVYALDLRSRRRSGDGSGRLYSDEQQAALESFLRRSGDKEVLFLVLSVPPVHLPQRAAQAMARLTRAGEDFSDRWSTLAHVRDRDRLLHVLRTHQARHRAQRLIVLSGDIHVGCAHAIRWDGDDTQMVQIVSSGLTHHVGRAMGIGIRWSLALNRRISTADGEVAARVMRLTSSEPGRNPYTRRNCGLVELEREAPDAPLRVRLCIYGHAGDRPVRVYRSWPL